MPSKVLVLGAGASAPYGFPLGSKLRREILDLQSVGSSIHAGLPDDPLFRQFVDAFEFSSVASIDAFLAHNQKFESIGKRAIAAVLLHYERRNPQCRPIDTSSGDWYSYLWNKYCHLPWEQLSFDDLGIVTFNYDRSLEQFLLYALQNTYSKPFEEAAEKLATLKIEHVYGRLGSLVPAIGKSDEYRPYGSGPDTPTLEACSRQLRVIHEERSGDDAGLAKCTSLFAGAGTICFLGFGFDRTNMSRLKARETCTPINGINSNGRRRLIASCYGLKAAEAIQAAEMCGAEVLERGVPASHGRQIHMQPGGLPTGFYGDDCLNTLRETLALG